MKNICGVILLVSCIVQVVHLQNEQCERDKTRTVRNVIYQDLIPLYKTVGAKIPYKCPFFKDRDRYLAHEEHKEKESQSRWTCQYCGKSFIGELYLDMHFHNRHADNIYTEKDSVCLGDFCEIFRCDVLSGAAKPTFWDLALCMEEDMEDLTVDCKELMTDCIPDTIHWNTSKVLTASLTKAVCSYLTCKKYYDAPAIEETEPPGTAYIVLTVLLSVSVIIYYCVAVNYFWTDTFSDVYDSDEYIGRNPESLFNSGEPFPKLQRRSHLHKKQTSSTSHQNIIQTESRADRDIFNVRSGLDTSIQNIHSTAGDS